MGVRAIIFRFKYPINFKFCFILVINFELCFISVLESLSVVGEEVV